MKITFPYMGCVTGYKKIMEKLGHEVIMPPKPTTKTIELGVKYSPEFICFPFKVITGTYIEAVRMGADTIVTSGGTGPCRAGLYGSVHKEILKDLGYDINFIVFDSMYLDFRKFMHNIMLVANGKNIFSIMKDVVFCFKMICQLDDFEKKIKKLRPYEIHKGDFNKAFAKMQEMYAACDTFSQLSDCFDACTKMMKEIPIDYERAKNPIRIGIVGEIYVVMESTTNMNIEQKLNDLGAEVESDQYISNWVKHNMNGLFGKSKSVEVIKKAKRFVTINCGGHDMENIGWMIDFAERGFDAVVHLMPFGCLPELVTASVVPTLSKELDIPILTLSLDEQTGAANNQTRIEAFVDLIKNKKAEKQQLLQGGTDHEIVFGG